MNERIIFESFQKYLEEKGFTKESLSLSNLPEIFVDYYQKVKFNGFNQQDDSDILLFQYGTHRWQEEAYFQINFTRQLYEVYEDESHQIYQLGLTFLYSPQIFSDVISFNEWSINFPDLEKFYTATVNSDGFKKAFNKTPLRKETNVYLL